MAGHTTKVTRKGQITIPIEIRKAHGIEEGDLIYLHEQGGQIILESSSDWVTKTSGVFAKYAHNVDHPDPDRELFERAVADEVAQSLDDESRG